MTIRSCDFNLLKAFKKIIYYPDLSGVHIFCVPGLWSSPSNSGSRPPPCSGFSLTMTDEEQAVMSGGRTPSGKSSEARDLHLPTMVSHFGLSNISYVARLKKEDKTELMD